MSWLEQHLEEFVKPQIGFIPNTVHYANFLSTSEMTTVKNAWRSIKSAAKGKTLLLPGRDVWIFEVLARRENYPTVFRPEISRLAVAHINLDPSVDWFIADTGFVGSIPNALKISNFKLLSHATGDVKTQIFPRRTGSRSLALTIEKTPKYWLTGRYNPNTGIVGQKFSDLHVFAQAAVFTQQIYKDSSPKFLSGSYHDFQKELRMRRKTEQ